MYFAEISVFWKIWMSPQHLKIRMKSQKKFKFLLKTKWLDNRRSNRASISRSWFSSLPQSPPAPVVLYLILFNSLHSYGTCHLAPKALSLCLPPNILSAGIKAPRDVIACHFYFMLNSANSSEWCQQLNGLLLNVNHREGSHSNPAKSQANAGPKALSTAGSLDQLILRFCHNSNIPLGLARTKSWQGPRPQTRKFSN